MKNKTLKILIIISFNVLFILNKSYCQTNVIDTAICLEIKGKITNIGNKSNETYKVELIYYNNVVSAENINVSKSFKFDLKKDAIYTIRISKDGFITKLISIYTKLPVKNNEIYRLDFETDLIETRKSKKLNEDALDFPITIIYYDDKANWFYFNEEYTSNIKRCIYNVKLVPKKL